MGQPGQRLCGANLSGDRKCKNVAMANGRCKYHGGKALSGSANPNFKHGRYSRHLPKHLAKAYDEIKADPKLLQLDDDVALLEARLNELISRLHETGTKEAWKKLGTNIEALRAAIEKGEEEIVINSLLRDMETAHASFLAEEEVWPEVYELLEQKRKLAADERKRVNELGLNVPVDEVVNLALSLKAVVLRYVLDETIKRKIDSEMEALIFNFNPHDGETVDGELAVYTGDA